MLSLSKHDSTDGLESPEGKLRVTAKNFKLKILIQQYEKNFNHRLWRQRTRNLRAI
jgi:hypothetical protein